MEDNGVTQQSLSDVAFFSDAESMLKPIDILNRQCNRATTFTLKL